MLLINTTSLAYPVYLSAVRMEHPDTSFPRNPTAADLAPFGYAEVAPTTRPTVADTWAQGVRETAPVQIDNVWTQQWEAYDIEHTAEEITEHYTTAVQQRLDTFARTRNYDNIFTACTYAASTNATFAAEGAYCVSARDATWAECYAILNAVTAGTRPVPTLAELLAELPELVWPA